MSGELAQSTEKVSNLSKTTQGLNDRVSNIELVMDMEVSVSYCSKNHFESCLES